MIDNVNAFDILGLSDYTNKELLQEYDNDPTYHISICEEICRRADMLKEWMQADGDTFESVVKKAYTILQEGL